MDDDGSEFLSLAEFTKVHRDFKVEISEVNKPILFDKFDVNRDEALSYLEFIEAVRDPISV
jgi:Ca2+-binding EF-hand superfamily protein